LPAVHRLQPGSVIVRGMALNRRQMLRAGAFGTGFVLVGNVRSLLTGPAAAAETPAVVTRRAAAGARVGRSWATGYGPLVADPAGILELPEGFSYRVLSEVGAPLTGVEGALPDRFDGMAYFELEGRRFLVRNSEQDIESEFPVVGDPSVTYDPAAQGGTTTTELDADGNIVAEYVSLAGTAVNCAGGTTPWGTWLTCEETDARTGDDGFTKDHGFVFEVDPLNPANNTDPEPLTALGRFDHEAVAIDPATGVVYLSEDASGPNGLLYRATPTTPLGGFGSLRDGAVLEAMVASGEQGFIADLSEITEPGTVLDLTWTAIPDPLAEEDPTRSQLNKVTRSRKFEGMWFGGGYAFVACSYARNDDGSVNEHDGQVWKIDPAADTIELVVQFPVNPDPDGDNFDGPDNITVSPWGGLLLCSDGEGTQHIYTVSADGVPSKFAQNVRDGSEFAGATFDTDGSVLYVNLQEPGTTFAITGPWDASSAATTSTAESTPGSSPASSSMSTDDSAPATEG